jgi:hypothetical protein
MQFQIQLRENSATKFTIFHRIRRSAGRREKNQPAVRRIFGLWISGKKASILFTRDFLTCQEQIFKSVKIFSTVETYFWIVLVEIYLIKTFESRLLDLEVGVEIDFFSSG